MKSFFPEQSSLAGYLLFFFYNSFIFSKTSSSEYSFFTILYPASILRVSIFLNIFLYVKYDGMLCFEAKRSISTDDAPSFFLNVFENSIYFFINSSLV